MKKGLTHPLIHSPSSLTKPRASDSANQKIPTVLVLWEKKKIYLELLDNKISKSVSMDLA